MSSEKGKIIVIEGTDGSGKATQTKILLQRLNEQGYRIQSMSFPCYDSPTGRIVAGPYLGKPSVSESFFQEGPDSVDPKIACAYYAADRRATLPKINQILESGHNLIIDRYVSSNMAHQGGKIKNPEEKNFIRI